ncbi:MAG: phospholipase D-like domain-containing protein [Pirellulales bacterium]
MQPPSDPDDSESRDRVIVAGHEMRLFAESPPLIDAMLADIRAAGSRVWMESYIFADDTAGRAVADALAERAQAGLDVRLMVDGFGSFSLPAALLNRLRDAGVQVHVFHSLGHVLRAPRILQALNQRNHRKLLVVDDGIAYFGGMNVVDQGGLRTAADARRRGLPTSAGWRDVHARMVGPRQAEIAALMERLWKRVHHQPREKPPRWSVPDFAHAPREALYFFDSRPTFTDRRPHRVLVPLIQQARREITVLMAYFIPRGRVLRELVKARRRGVRVRVIVPEASDVKLVGWATRHFYEHLLKRGIRIYERRDRMLHGKAMEIDGRFSVIGSCNLDVRSLRINLEFFAVIHSPQLALALGRICQEEIEASRRVDAGYCRRRSFWQRQLHRLAWRFRNWL